MNEKATPTRDKLLDAAVDLMIGRGYEATGVEDICKSARVTKGSFFHYFDSKEALGKAAVERFYETMRGKFGGFPQLRQEDPLDRLLAWPDVVATLASDPASSRGCLIGTFAQEISGSHETLRRTCEGMFASTAGMLTSDIEQAVARHRPKAKINARTLADYMLAGVQGSMILAKARKDPAAVVETMAHLKRYLSQLFGR
jgi:TetR/AcrR family transcriptional regulator, transcriptional repressor for nem operon